MHLDRNIDLIKANTMEIFSVRKLSFICILPIGLLSQAFGQSLVDIMVIFLICGP
jgi:hypothetical protein